MPPFFGADIASRPVSGDPTLERVVSGPATGFAPSSGYMVAAAYDDVVRQYGPWVYELMRLDPAVSGSFGLFFAGILAEGARVEPAITAEPGETIGRGKRKGDLKLAQEVAEYWQRGLDNLTPGIDQVLWEYLDEACTGGCSMAEPVFELAEEGPDKGRLVLKSLQVKPRWAWAFRVDPYMRVPFLCCYTINGWVDVPRDHFMSMAWQPRCGDPRGTRLLRPAYPAWNVKLQAIPDYAEYLKHFADPSLVLTGGAAAETIVRTDPATGAQTTITVPEQLVAAGTAFKNRSVLGLEYGATATFLQSQGTGAAYITGFDWADREIFRSIILGARAMQEAKHGSKADVGSSMDQVGMAVVAGRKPLMESVRRELFWRGTMLNWGKAVADRLTPKLAFGVADHLSPDIMDALSNAWQKGLLQVPQRPWMLSKIGAPQDPAPDPNAPPPVDPNADPNAPDDPNAPEDPNGPPAKPPTKNKRQPAAPVKPDRTPPKRKAG